MISNYISGIKYFLGGFESIQQPGVRRYAILPILINILLFGAGIYLLGNQFSSLMEQYLPDSEGYWIILVYLLWIIFGLLILIIIFFTFTLLANLLGAPFNGPLAAAIERNIEGHIEQTVDSSLIGDIAKAISGELRKWLYYLFWAIPLLIISFIPAINIVSPFLWFIFGAWMMAIEYMDYPMGNHNYTFPTIKETLRQHRMLSLGFGTAVMAFTMIPVINLVVMPAAVAGASKLWVKEIKMKIS
jgi:CysZ protein